MNTECNNAIELFKNDKKVPGNAKCDKKYVWKKQKLIRSKCTFSSSELTFLFLHILNQSKFTLFFCKKCGNPKRGVHDGQRELIGIQRFHSLQK